MPALVLRRVRRLLATATVCAVAVTGIGAATLTTASPALAQTQDMIADGTWLPQLTPTKSVVTAGLIVEGGGGSNCSGEGGVKSSAVSGGITFNAPATDSLQVYIGGKGGLCSDVDSSTSPGGAGIGGTENDPTGDYSGGSGGAAVAVGPGLTASGGAGGGAATTVYLNSVDAPGRVAFAGGGGGIGGGGETETVEQNSAGGGNGGGSTSGGSSPSNPANPQSTNGAGGSDGDLCSGGGGAVTNCENVVPGIGGAGGTVQYTAGSTGAPASVDNCLGGCGGGGGGGGGSASATGATAGNSTYANLNVGGGGGGGGATSGVGLSTPLYSPSSSRGIDGRVRVWYINITAGALPTSVNIGDSFATGATDFTTDGGVSGAAFSLGAGAPAGLSIDAAGVISGTATTAGTYTFDVIAAGTSNTNPWSSMTDSGPVFETHETVTMAVVGPSATAISPATGDVAGGNTVTITGTQFADGMTATIGGSACTSTVVVSPTSLTCVIPQGTVGNVPVVVTIGGFTGTIPGGYTYTSNGTNPGAKPSPVRNLRVIGGPRAPTYRIKWAKPSSGNVTGYRVTIKQLVRNRLVLRKKIGPTQLTYRVTRNYLLNSALRLRGDVGASLKFRVTVEALNGSTASRLRKQTFLLSL